MIKKIRAMLQIYGREFGKLLQADGWFFVTLVILNLPIFLQTFIFGDRLFTFRDLLSRSVANFYTGAVLILIFCAAVHFLLSRFQRAKFFLQALILACFAVFFVVDVFLIYKFGTTLHRHMIQSVLSTNFNEVGEFLQMCVLNPKIILGTAGAVLLIVLAVKLSRRFFHSLSEGNLSRLSYHLLIIFTPALLVCAYWLCSFVLTVAKAAFDNTIFGRNFNNIFAAVSAIGNEPEIFAEMDSQDEKIISNDSKIPNVVFILGEATTRNHMQLYGYELPTTPLLVRRYENGEIFKFSDVIACANYTLAAMEKIFTFAEKDDAEEQWYKTPNIFDILRRAGYHTFWLSNQSPRGWWGSIEKIYSARCDEKFFAESERAAIYERKFDGVLLPVLDEILTKPHEKNFYLVHLYGAHGKYRERYPEDFAKFTAADENKSTAEGKKIAAEYDNAILYNDYVVDEIIRRFEDKNALVIYIPDHGEEIFEDGREFYGHSTEELGNRSMIEIPMLVWTSAKFRELYPEKISALAASVDNPYRTDFMIHTILDLLDICSESFNPSKSVVNEKFDSFRLRIYNGEPYTLNKS